MFIDSYIVMWKLEDETGLQWWEVMDEMSLSDFEVAYGNITDRIVQIEMRLKRP